MKGATDHMNTFWSTLKIEQQARREQMRRTTLTYKEAQEKLGVSRQRLNDLVATGKIDRLDPQPALLKRSDVDRLVRERKVWRGE